VARSESSAPRVRPGPLRIVAETEDYLVVDKPAHLQAHPSKPDGSFTLWHGLRELLAFELLNGGQVSIINRLDRETSGLTLVAKNAAAARQFSMLMMRRGIKKEYLAIVHGWPAWTEREIDAPIARQGERVPSAIYLKQCVHPLGASAQTGFRVERRFMRAGAAFSVVRAFPHTGRMHQIRVHLSHAGHPIVGDKIYGNDERHYLQFIDTGWTGELAKALVLPRHALHSAVLRIDELGLVWEAPLPPDMAEFIAGDEGIAAGGR
jgi:23S rRNA pseudouridine1911/1915/1917 synthase